MHYANGRYAQELDPVVLEYGGKPTVGVIHSLNANALSCNATLAVVVPGGTAQFCVSVNECWHAEDALDLLIGRGAKGYELPQTAAPEPVAAGGGA